MQQLTIVKVGGAILEAPDRCAATLHAFAQLPAPKLLVHGGGRLATTLAQQLGHPATMVQGRRVTDDQTLRIVTMTYAGLVNKTLVARLQAAGCQALGITGADLDTITSRRRPPVAVTLDDGTTTTVDYGNVGDPIAANATALNTLLQAGITPVIAPITHDRQGNLLNTNADTIAQTVATALAHHYHTTLIFAFELPGVLADPADPTTLITHVDPDTYTRHRQQHHITGGMIPKVDNAFQALHAGVARVVITRYDNIASPQAGTTITL